MRVGEARSLIGKQIWVLMKGARIRRAVFAYACGRNVKLEDGDWLWLPDILRWSDTREGLLP